MITCEMVGEKNIVVVSRDKNNAKTIQIDSTFRPYFYNDKGNKVGVRTPSEVSRERQKFDKTYEANIPYVLRYMIDRIGIPIDKCNLKKQYIDIETDDSIDTIRVPKPVISITVYDTYLKKFIQFLYQPETNYVNQEKEKSVYVFPREDLMLLKFIQFIRSTDPDLVTGWNVDFDIGYLVNRIKMLGMDANRLSPLSMISVNSFSGETTIKGRVVFDLMKAYKKMINNKLESYSLDYVCKKEIGEGKEKIKLSPGQLWRKNPEELLRYNYIDVELLKKLDDKMNIINYFDEIRRTVGCPWDCLWWNSNLVDTMFLRFAKKREIKLPTNSERIVGVHKKYEGAFVKMPVPGVHKNVIVLDLSTLYPSIIISCNMDYYSIADTYEEGFYRLKNGVFFKKEPKGMTTEILEHFITLRKKFKTEMKKHPVGSDEYKICYTKQFALKSLTNTVYGVLGSPRFRLYDRRIAESITFLGRDIIKRTIEFVEENGHEVLYGDTDSIFVKARTGNPANEGQELEKKLNEMYDIEFRWSKDNRIRISFEKVYSRIYLSKGKKRYVGYICHDGQEKVDNHFDMVGFETVRSDTARITKRMLKKIYKMLLDGKTPSDISFYVKTMKQKLLNEEFSIYDIGIPKTMVKDIKEYAKKTFHVEAAKYSNKYLGTSYKAGSKFRVLYVYRVVGFPQTDLVAFDESMDDLKLEVDWKKMMPVLIDNKIGRIAESLSARSGLNTLERWTS